MISRAITRPCWGGANTDCHSGWAGTAMGRRLRRCAVLVALLVMCRAVAADIVPLTRLTDASARCMDGTLAGFYHQRATDAASAARWVIHMQGGGECVDSVQCARRFNSSLASSNFFPDYINLTYDPAAANHTRRAASPAPTPHQHLMFFPAVACNHAAGALHQFAVLASCWPGWPALLHHLFVLLG